MDSETFPRKFPPTLTIPRRICRRHSRLKSYSSSCDLVGSRVCFSLDSSLSILGGSADSCGKVPAGRESGETFRPME